MPTPYPVITGTAAEVALLTPAQGQLVHEIDTGVFRVGDGATSCASLASRSFVSFISHGSAAGTARPGSTAVVQWEGSVAPTNAVTLDLWFDTTNQLTKRFNGTTWDAAGGATYQQVVKHGSVAATARPTGALVRWIGTVAPSNAATSDTWLDTSSTPYVERAWTGSAFVAIGAGAEIVSAVSYQGFTIPNTNTWTDIPSMYMKVYAGIPWELQVSCGLEVTTNATPVSTAIYILMRVVDAATSSITYGFLNWQWPFNDASVSYYQYASISQLMDPLAADTVVKLQGIGANNANYTYNTYVPPSSLGGACTMRAVRRA